MLQTHTDCVILIAFQLQQWLNDRASMLRYMYIACPVTTVLRGLQRRSDTVGKENNVVPLPEFKHQIIPCLA